MKEKCNTDKTQFVIKNREFSEKTFVCLYVNGIEVKIWIRYVSTDDKERRLPFLMLRFS